MSAFEKSVKGPDIQFNYKWVPLGWSESVIRDHLLHGTTNELMNHFPGWICWFLWCAVIWVISNHWSRSTSSTWNAPYVVIDHPIVFSQLLAWTSQGKSVNSTEKRSFEFVRLPSLKVKFLQLWEAIIIAHVRRITFKLGNFTHFKALHNWSMLKVEKTVEESILPLEL